MADNVEDMPAATMASKRSASFAGPRLAALSAGAFLFLLDLVLVVAVTPLAYWWGHAGGFVMRPYELLAFVYADLLVLYAMGLYRRETMVEPLRAVARLPVVVAMGALLGAATNATLIMTLAWPLPPPRWPQSAALPSPARGLRRCRRGHSCSCSTSCWSSP